MYGLWQSNVKSKFENISSVLFHNRIVHYFIKSDIFFFKKIISRFSFYIGHSNLFVYVLTVSYFSVLQEFKNCQFSEYVIGSNFAIANNVLQWWIPQPTEPSWFGSQPTGNVKNCWWPTRWLTVVRALQKGVILKM